MLLVRPSVVFGAELTVVMVTLLVRIARDVVIRAKLSEKVFQHVATL